MYKLKDIRELEQDNYILISEKVDVDEIQATMRLAQTLKQPLTIEIDKFTSEELGQIVKLIGFNIKYNFS